jgi:hypothetical protein
VIPIATTTISVLRLSDALAQGDLMDVDASEASTDYAPVATHVRAQISEPSGIELLVGGEQTDVRFRLSCDVTDIVDTDRILDESTGEHYAIVWARRRAGLSLDHVAGELRQVRGETR